MKKLVVGIIALLLVTFMESVSSFGQDVSMPRGEVRIVDNNPKNWAFLTLNIFEHLVEYDKRGQLVPRLATGWRWLDDRTLEMTLRPGVQFHNGEAFNTDIVKLNFDEQDQLIQQHGVGAHFHRQLYATVLDRVDREHQQQVIRQMERHTHDRAYFLFLYNPIQLYAVNKAVNKAVNYVPYVHTVLDLGEISVTEQHWSVRKKKAVVHRVTVQPSMNVRCCSLGRNGVQCPILLELEDKCFIDR